MSFLNLIDFIFGVVLSLQKQNVEFLYPSPFISPL